MNLAGHRGYTACWICTEDVFPHMVSRMFWPGKFPRHAKTPRIWQASALLVIIVGLEMLSPTQADDSFYAFFVILLILQFPYQNRLGGAFLATLGRHSMPMWMCHTFLSIYLFPNFIYGFRYPVLIFVVLTALSYAISIVVLKSSTVLENLLKLHNNHNHI